MKPCLSRHLAIDRLITSSTSRMRTKAVLVAVGGASCSGKTILAKHLRRTLPNSHIIHQDDFAPPENQLPFAKVNFKWRDWDDPATCVNWLDFQRTLAHVRETGEMPEGHTSHDHLNELDDVAVDSVVLDKWKEKFKDMERKEAAQGVKIIWYIVDGFVLYWDKISRGMFDVRMFLRVPCNTLKTRREARQTYVTQDGSTWVDPPKYFEGVVYPAYQKAHAEIFTDGDVEHGSVKAEWSDFPRGLLVMDPGDGEAEVTRVYELALERLWQHVTTGV